MIHNELGDAGMDAVLGYVKKDVMMRRVYLQSNSITVCPVLALQYVVPPCLHPEMRQDCRLIYSYRQT